ncbi:hypothetical protein [Novosphingobium sp.]|uniref:hypothetical protein n=1 Tax=Novosphingobium sp. TaxID=1874826 RepID=UPI0028A67C69|nr:hypothetical protein [Novosphingobium sp.]
MLTGLTVLIVEDGGLIGHDLAAAVEDLHRFPIVVATVSEGLRVVATATVSAAILDAQFPDGEVTPLAVALIERAVPFVVHSGGTLSDALNALFARHAVVPKPALSSAALAALERECLGDQTMVGPMPEIAFVLEDRRC